MRQIRAFGPSALLIAPGQIEMCEAPGRANLVLLRPNPTFTIPPEVAYTPFCRRLCGKASRKCLAFPADMLLHPVDGNKTGKVILELDVYYAISLPIKFRIFDRGVL